MKPKTKFEKQLVAFSNRLRPISEKKIQWAFDNCLEHEGFRIRKTTITCMDCGHSWDDKTVAGDTETICPHCGRKIIVRDTRKLSKYQEEYFCVATVSHGYQVLRFVNVRMMSRKGYEPRFFSTEVARMWIDKSGFKHCISLLRGGMFNNGTWNYSSSLEIRRNIAPYIIWTSFVYPKTKIIPELKKRGLSGNFHGLSPLHLIPALFNYSYAETLLKAGQYSLLEKGLDCGAYEWSNHWNSIKICFRNNYKVNDARLWFDYLQLLKYFKKDVQNAKYICPDDLKQAHDMLVAKKMKIEEIKRLKREQEELAKLQKRQDIYLNNKGKFFGICFSDGPLRIKVLESVEEFYKEGEIMHHCVFSNKYYEKKDSLILSARIGDKHIETVEVSLRTFKVVQCYGAYNKFTPYHDNIKKLVEKNMKIIKQRMSA